MARSSWWETVRALVRAHRRRIAFAALMIGGVLVATTLNDAFPRDVQLHVRFGPRHDALREAHLLFEREGAAAGEQQAVRFARAGGFPPGIDHSLSLPPGRYRVEATLRDARGARRVERALRVPTDGVVYLDLFERRREGR